MTTASISFSTTIEQALLQLEEKLIQAVPVDDSTLGDRIRALIKAGGKRLRPLVTLYVGEIYGANPDRLLSVAAGLEMLHTATLVHDDLVDNATERRGVETLNAAFPMGLVVLSGDLLFAEAARLVAESDHVGVVRSFARALSEICYGEILQAQTKHTLTNIEEYYRRIYGKTGSLFRTAAETGAMLGTDDPETIELFSEYGRLLGLAFQIIDDTLDYTSDVEQLGKPIGHDLEEGIISLPALLYYQAHQANLNGSFKKVVAGRGSSAEISATIDAIRQSGAVDEALEIARDFAYQARNLLADIPNGPARQGLIDLAEYAVNRDH